MPSSLRGRLQIWYGVLLAGVIVCFTTLLYLQVRRWELGRVDSELVAIADYLDANLRGFPPQELNASLETPPGLPSPPPEHRDRMLASLDFPEATRSLTTGNERQDWYFKIVRENGTVLKASDNAKDLELPQVDPWPRGRPELRSERTVRQALTLGPHETRILVGKTITTERAQLSSFALRLFGVGLAVLGVGLAGGWWLSGRMVRPLEEMSKAAEAVSEKNLSQRIDLATIDDELVGLATALNNTFDRLEQAFAQQAQLTADASHELRTPLATLRTQAELALSKTRTPDEYRQALKGCLDAARRMTRLVDSMMTLARADARQLAIEKVPVDFEDLVKTAVEQLQPLAFSKQVQVKVATSPASVLGDATNLSRVVTNLVSNAIYYNRSHGRVDVQLKTTTDSVLLTVRDTGKGIPEESRDHLFNRFFRADKSRSRTSGGHGLGLAITKAIVEAHDGDIDFTSEEENGTTFRVKLPRQGTPSI
jgi:two-component system OmpR family sensor kinase